MPTGERFLEFKCSGCGNCCKDPLLPLTDQDVIRIQQRTGDQPRDFVRWVDRHGIDMDDEPEAFVRLKQGKRVMVMRHEGGGCRYLGDDNRCTIYTSRPLGCRIFPFDPSFDKQGKLKRLKLIQATECEYTLDGHNDVDELRSLSQRHEAANAAYQAKIVTWNREQDRRRRKGHAAQTAGAFLKFLGVRS